MKKANTQEASDWLSDLPVTWRSKRLKYAAPLRAERGQGSATDSDYIGLEHIESWTGKLIPSASSDDLLPDDVDSGEQGLVSRFFAGDVLLGKLRPYLAKAWLAERDGHCTNELLPLQSGYDFNPSYLRWVVLCSEFISLVDGSTFGAKMPRANWDFIGGLRVPIPPLHEQERIAKYLSEETEKIDALILEKRSLLELTEEKRSIATTNTLLCGIEPGMLKSADTDWLKKIPSRWTEKRAKYLFAERDERNVDGERTLLALTREGLIPRSEITRRASVADDYSRYKVCLSGDLVMNKMQAWSGAFAVAKQEGIVSPDYTVFQPLLEVIADYYAALFKLSILKAKVLGECRGMGIAFLRLNTEDFYSIRIPVPPLDEQRAIVAHLESERESTAEIEQALRDSIQLLQERRRALITAAVTGQIPVETMAA